MKTTILFFIHDLGHGGAEKVLVNLVNNMDCEKFDITVMALFGGGVNEQFLKKGIRYQYIFSRCIPGNSKFMKLMTPRQLHQWFIKEKYDIEVAYLEGPDSRIISGCPNPDTRLAFWIHCTMRSEQEFAGSFRSPAEARDCYNRFDKAVFVSREVERAFLKHCPLKEDRQVLYNTNESNRILALSRENITEGIFDQDKIRLIAVGKLEPVKGFDRLVRIHQRLINDGLPVHTYLLGEGKERTRLEKYVKEHKIAESFTFLGYQTNPYQFMARSDLFVCTSFSEGFSTAATEALIIGVPVITTQVSGMKEMLGENNE